MMNVLHILVVATPVLKNKLRRSCIYFFPYYFMHSSKMIIYSSTHYHHQPWERYHLYASMAFWAGHLQVIIRHFTHTQDILFLFYIYTQYIFTDYFPSLLSLESSMMNGEIYIINTFILFFFVFFAPPILRIFLTLSLGYSKKKRKGSWRRMALGDYITLREMWEVGWGRSSWAKIKREREEPKEPFWLTCVRETPSSSIY